MARKAAKGKPVGDRSLRTLEIALLGLCLCILALRVTYTEAPTAQMLVMPGTLADTVYSLTLSGLLVFAFVLWLLWRIFGSGLEYRVTGIEIGLVLFAAAGVVSAFGASDARSAITHIMMMLGPIFAALLLAQVLNTPGRIRLVLTVIAALGVVSAYQCAEQRFVSNAIMIEQYEKSPEVLLEPLGIQADTFRHFLFEHRLYSRGIRGFFTTSNSAASFAILASFAAIALLIRRFQDRQAGQQKSHDSLFVLLGALIVVVGLFLTKSKGGILAFLAGLAVFGLRVALRRRFGTGKRILAGVVVAAALLVAGAGYATVQYGLKHDRLPGGNSMLVRWQYWVASAQMYGDHPLAGVGPGNFSHHYPHHKPAAAPESVADPHNFLLSLLTQYGPLGLIGFLAMVCIPLWRSLTYRICPSDAPQMRAEPPFRALPLGALAVISLCLLFIRPLLIPPMAADGLDVLLYQIMTLYVTPAAAFLIGFLLLAAPLGDGRGRHFGFAPTALLAALGSSILAVLLHNLIDFALFEPGVWMAFWTLMACLIATRPRPPSGDSISIRSVPVLKLIALVVAVVLFGAYSHYVWWPVSVTTANIRRAQRAISAGRFDVAHHHLEAASEADPLSPIAAGLNGRLYMQQYEQAPRKQPALLEQAAGCYREAMERSPADYKNYENLAMAYSRLGQHERAYDWYLRATERYGGCERLWFELARAAEELGRTDVALTDYRKAVEIEESYRRQFRRMYPERERVISRFDEEDYRFARERIEALSQ